MWTREVDEAAGKLLDRLEKVRAPFEEQMVDGRCADWSDYKRICGIVQGLTLARRELVDLVKELRKSEE